MIREFDGYLFHKSGNKLYNPSIVINFLLKNDRPLSDPNVRPSEDILRFISRNPHTKPLLSTLFGQCSVELSGGFSHKLSITHLKEAKEENQSHLLSFLYFMGALTISPPRMTSTPTTMTNITATPMTTIPTIATTMATTMNTTPSNVIYLRIPNNSTQREYLLELKHIYTLSQDEVGSLNTAVTSMASGDLQTLCDFITSHLFFLEQNNDVIYSQESTLKSAFIFAVAISRGPSYSHSEYNEVPKNFLDVFFDIGPGVHIEFKNTTVGQIDRRYNTKEWDKMNAFSDDICKKSTEELFTLPLYKFDNMYCKYLNREMHQVGDKWKSLILQAQSNRDILKKYRSQIGKSTSFLTYVVYRIGLKRLLWQLIEP
eukprot:TRINITY_DN17877_c0_g1_i1.p1 TRINITY_DN17877_c0_g1~~TRINITY_DN17877_c0_g1_i1.p1  ORF type:complete len:389 (+),score=38.40 TRINITY_DN17877_c0_g1_i1:54-1169(+)